MEREGEENDIFEKLDILLDRFDDFDMDMDVFKTEVKQLIKQELDAFKKEIIGIINKTVNKELLEQNRSTVVEKTQSDIYSSRLESYAGKVKQSQLENIIVEPKKKQDTAVTI